MATTLLNKVRSHFFRLCGHEDATVTANVVAPIPRPQMPQYVHARLCLGLSEPPHTYMDKYPGLPLRSISHMMTFVRVDIKLSLFDQKFALYRLEQFTIHPHHKTFDTCFTDMSVLDVAIPAEANLRFMKHVVDYQRINMHPMIKVVFKDAHTQVELTHDDFTGIADHVPEKKK